MESWLNKEEELILQELGRSGPVLRMILTELRVNEQKRAQCCKEQNAKLELILKNQTEILQDLQELLSPPPAVAFKVTVTVNDPNKSSGEDKMTKLKATVDFQLLDNGTVQFTASPVDAVGNPASLPSGAGVPSWASSDPSTISIAPSASDPTGLTAIGTPLKLGTDIVATVSVLLADGATTLSGSATPVDVVAGAASGFAVAEQ